MGTFLFTIAIVVINAVWEGFAFSVLWRWFITTTFHVAAISLPQAIGIALIVGLVVPTNFTAAEEQDAYKIAKKMLIHVFAAPATAILIGWIVKSFL